jgi:hypothetical protein
MHRDVSAASGCSYVMPVAATRRPGVYHPLHVCYAYCVDVRINFSGSDCVNVLFNVLVLEHISSNRTQKYNVVIMKSVL